MQIRNWIHGKRIEVREFVFLFCLVLLSMSIPAVAVAAERPGAQSTVGATGLNDSAHDTTVAGTIQQLVTNHTVGAPAGFQLAVDSPQGPFTASLGPNLSREAQQSLSQGAPVQVSGQMQIINGKQYLLARTITVGGKQTIVRNENGFLVHTSKRSCASGNNTAPYAPYRSAK